MRIIYVLLQLKASTLLSIMSRFAILAPFFLNIDCILRHINITISVIMSIRTKIRHFNNVHLDIVTIQKNPQHTDADPSTATTYNNVNGGSTLAEDG